MPVYRHEWGDSFTYNDYKNIKTAESEYTKLGITPPSTEDVANMVMNNLSVRNEARIETLKQLKDFVEKIVPDTPKLQQTRDLQLTLLSMIEIGTQPKVTKKAAREQFEYGVKVLLADFAKAKGEFTLGDPEKITKLREAMEQRIKDLGV